MIQFEEFEAAHGLSVQERLLGPTDYQSDAEGDGYTPWEDWRVGE